jgi:hypothetical protein
MRPTENFARNVTRRVSGPRSLPMAVVLTAAVLAAIPILALASPARANGRYPAAGQIVVDPSDPAHIVVEATYGLLTTRDAGLHWAWICEQGIGFSSEEDPAVAVTADGSVLAGIVEGLFTTHGDSCAWSPVAALAQRPVLDVSTLGAMPASAVGIAWTSIVDTTTALWRSDDDAVTWMQMGVALPAGFSGVTVDVAPSDPMTIVVSGGFADATAGLEISSDGGASWTPSTVPGADALRPPYLSAVDPTSPATLYVRVPGMTADALLVTHDGGSTWKTAFQGTGGLFGFALSPDGATVLVGGTSDGVWRASTSDLTFAKVSPLGVLCLAWSSAGVYACADERTDGFTVGLSTDEGATYTAVMHRADLTGPLACDAGTSVGEQCPSLWPATECVIGATACDASPGDVGVTETAAPPPAVHKACACGEAPGQGTGDAGPFALALAAAWACWARARSAALTPPAPLSRRPVGRGGSQKEKLLRAPLPRLAAGEGVGGEGLQSTNSTPVATISTFATAPVCFSASAAHSSFGAVTLSTVPCTTARWPDASFGTKKL